MERVMELGESGWMDVDGAAGAEDWVLLLGRSKVLEAPAWVGRPTDP